MALWFQKPDGTKPPVIDRAYLERLAGHIGAGETRELLADGMLELSDRLDRLAELATDNDVAAISELAHDIAGHAGHLGLSALSALAVEVCRQARAANPPTGRALTAPLEAARAAAVDALGRYCAGDDQSEPIDH